MTLCLCFYVIGGNNLEFFAEAGAGKTHNKCTLLFDIKKGLLKQTFLT
jgi:hypothetical protein